MEGALAWIGQIAEWFGQFIPRVRNIRVTHQAVKFYWGKAKICQPGLAFYWPLTTDFVTYPTARQPEELRGQTLETTDGKTILVGGMLIYEIGNILQLLTATYDPAQSIKDLSLTAVHDVCCQFAWPDLKEQQRRGWLDTKLKNETQKALAPYGVTVIKVMLTDMAPCRVLKVVQTTAKGEES